MIAFDLFLAFSCTTFALLLKEHHVLCPRKGKPKRPDNSKKTAKSKMGKRKFTFARNF